MVVLYFQNQWVNAVLYMWHVHLKVIWPILVILTTYDHSTDHKLVKYCGCFIFLEPVSEGGSYDMGHVEFQANSIFTTWLTTRLYFLSWSNDVWMKKLYYFIVIIVFSTNIQQYIAIWPSCSVVGLFWPLMITLLVTEWSKYYGF